MASSVEPGTLYFWGSSSEGSAALLQVADGAQVRAVDGPPTGDGPVAAILADEGIAWITPASQDAAMDHQEEMTDASSASRLAAAAEAVSIARGSNHTLILSSDGSVFSAGSNSFGQCGLGHMRGISLPQQVVTLRGHPVKMVACGDEHSAFVTTDGCLYTCGRGSEGQLGLACSSEKGSAVGESLGSVAAPRFVSALDGVQVATVACGCRFTVIVLLDGALLAMGEGRCGQLGIGRVCATRGRPSLVARGGADRSPFVNVAAGWAHALAVTESGHLYSWGDNSRGQLGHGDTTRRVVPTRIEDSSSSSSSSSSAAAVESKETDDQDGLALGGSERPVQVVAAAAGQFHSAAVTPQGLLVTWGASLSGQLGHSAGLKPSVDVVMPAVGDSRASTPHARMEVHVDRHDNTLFDRASPAVQALAAQLPSLDSPPPGSRHSSRPGSRQPGFQSLQRKSEAEGSLGVSVSAGMPGRGAPHDEIGMGRFAGDTDGATRGILTPFQRFRERLAREDGGRAGRDAPPAHIVATHSINVAALRRLPGLESTLQTALAGSTARQSDTEAQAALAAKVAGRKAAQAVLRAEPHDDDDEVRGSAHDHVLAAAAEAEAAAAAAMLAQTAVGGGGDSGAGGWAGWSGGLDLLQDQDTAAAALSASVGRSPTLRARAAREAAAAAWASARPRLDREAAPPIRIPAQVTLPDLNGRIVTRVACGSHSTVVFAPAVVSSCSPRMGWARGGHWLAIIGPGLASLTHASRRLTDVSLGLGPDMLLPVAQEEGVGCRVRGVLARLTRPGHIEEEALAGRLDDPSPDEVAAFDPAEDAARAAVEPLVCFVPVFEVLPGSKFANLAAVADARLDTDESRGPRYGLQPDVLVIRAPKFPGTCDIMVELLARDRTVADALAAEAAAETEAQEAGIDTPQGPGFVAGSGAASLLAESEWASNTAAAGVWAVCRGAATGSVVEQPVLHTAVPEAVVLPAGGAVAISGSGLMGMLQKDPSAREAVDALMAEVDFALQQQEDDETEATATNAETLVMKEDEVEVHHNSKTGEMADAITSESALQISRMFGTADQPVTTAVRWIVSVGGEVRTVTAAQPCWWQCDFRETEESGGGKSAIAGGSVSSSSSLGAASHALLSGRGGGGEEADGDAEQGVFDAKLHATVPAMTAADLGFAPGDAAAEAVVELQPELSPNGSEWIPCPGISLTGVLPTLQAISSPATVPMAAGGVAGPQPCALTVAGSGFVDTGAVVARLVVMAASSPEAVGIVTDAVPLKVASSLQMVAPSGMYAALEAVGAVPRSGWAAVSAQVSFDGGARFLPVPARTDNWHTVVVDADATLSVPALIALEGGLTKITVPDESHWLSAPRMAEATSVIGCLVSWRGVDGEEAGVEPLWLPAEATDEPSSLVVHIPSIADTAATVIAGTATVELMLAGCSVPGVLGRLEAQIASTARLFVASQLEVMGVGPKKIGPGAKVDISLKGLAPARLPIDLLKEHGPTVWVSTGAEQSPGMVADGQGFLLQGVLEAPESWLPDQDNAEALVSVKVTLPTLDAGLVPGEQAVSVSLDNGHTWSQLGSAKIGKK